MPKKIYGWQISIWRDSPHQISSGKCKLKRDTTTHLSEWPKSGTLTTPYAGKGVDKHTSNLLLVGMQNGTATLENSLVVSYKINILLSHDSAMAPWYLPKWVEQYCPYKNLHMDL